ncbi:MAG: phospholipase D-like domain-containing protein [Nitrospirae bacterium]|nr:phospholipase D-like domain-containing protein [Nitrospirota bacterium]
MKTPLSLIIIPLGRWARQVWRPQAALLVGALLCLPAPPVAEGWPRSEWNASRSHSRGECPSPPRRSFPLGFLGEHYSPEENLEAIDVGMIDHARRKIDIAMYAFTDRRIADALIRAADRGVRIRLYRDRTQVRDRGDKTRRLLSSSSHANITVLVKHNSFRNIMHLKAYLIDGTYLRTGSANWSPPGEGALCRRGRRTHWNQQDNNLFITRDPHEVRHFEKTFDRIFSRSGSRHGNRPWNPAMGRPRHKRRD